MCRNKIYSHRLFDGLMKVMFPFFSGVLHSKFRYFPAKNVRHRCMSSYAIQPRDLITRSPWVCRIYLVGSNGIPRVTGAFISLGWNWWSNMHASDRFITESTPHYIPPLDFVLDLSRVILTHNWLETFLEGSFITGALMSITKLQVYKIIPATLIM